MESVVRFGVSMPTELLQAFDSLLGERGYASRSEAVRDLVRRELVSQTWEQESGPVIGILSIVYDHHAGVSGAIMGMQHASHQVIVCNVHLHLDENRCMEVIVLRGQADEIKEIAGHVTSLKGVEYGQLSAAAIG